MLSKEEKELVNQYKYTTTHEQVHISLEDDEADVDKEMAPIILECWKNDIWTLLSCQENHPGVAWIEFLSPYCASKFMDIVANKYESKLKSLYNRIAGNWDSISEELEKWEYNILPFDFNLTQTPDENDEYLNETHTGKPEFGFSVSIRFPRSDMKTILRRLRKASKENEIG